MEWLLAALTNGMQWSKLCFVTLPHLNVSMLLQTFDLRSYHYDTLLCRLLLSVAIATFESSVISYLLGRLVTTNSTQVGYKHDLKSFHLPEIHRNPYPFIFLNWVCCWSYVHVVHDFASFMNHAWGLAICKSDNHERIMTRHTWSWAKACLWQQKMVGVLSFPKNATATTM